MLPDSRKCLRNLKGAEWMLHDLGHHYAASGGASDGSERAVARYEARSPKKHTQLIISAAPTAMQTNPQLKTHTPTVSLT